MKKNRLGFMALSMLSVVAFATSCGGTSSFVPPTPEDAVGDWTTVKKLILMKQILEQILILLMEN